jgi:ABC transporter substrate binding protein
MGGVGLSRRRHFVDEGSTEIASASPSAILNSTNSCRPSLSGLPAGLWQAEGAANRLRRGSPVSGIRRREFITLLGGAAAWPIAALAQQQAMPVIGYIGTGSRESDAFRLPSFHRGLHETGYVEGQNVTIEYRWAEGRNDRLPALATELVRRQVAAIAVPASTPGVLAAKAATTTIPIVFYIGLDPVELGLVASLHRPGGNITGVTGWNVTVGPKRLELLHQVVPTAISIALLVNPTSPDLADADLKEQQGGCAHPRAWASRFTCQYRTRL